MKAKSRFKQTEFKIKLALIELINEEGLDEITVQQITAVAKINRATFYHHYLDKPDLIEKQRNNIIHQIEIIAHNELSQTMFYQDPNSPLIIYPLFEQVINFLDNDRNFFRAWLGPKGDLKTVLLIKKNIGENIITRLDQLNEKHSLTTPIPKQFAQQLVIDQLYSIIDIWLQQTDISKAEVIKILMKTRYLSPFELMGIASKK